MIQISRICNQLLAEIFIFIRKSHFSILYEIDLKMIKSIEIWQVLAVDCIFNQLLAEIIHFYNRALCDYFVVFFAKLVSET